MNVVTTRCNAALTAPDACVIAVIYNPVVDQHLPKKKLTKLANYVDVHRHSRSSMVRITGLFLPSACLQ